MEEIVDLELAKKLKFLGFSKPTEFYYLDKDLLYVKAGLKQIKIGKNKRNHNKYEDFVYSAPTVKTAIQFLNQENIKFKVTIE